MGLNLPAGAVERVSFGQGILKIGAPGATPTVDVGYARGSTLTITRQKLDLFQGVPRTLVRTFSNQEDTSMQFTGLEWNLERLLDLLGSGAFTTAAGGVERLRFGGKIDFAEVSVLFQHRTPTEGTAEVRIWRAQGQGELSLNFGDDFQEFNYQFRGLPATTDWGGVAITEHDVIELEFTPGVAA
jgi:hypothetical protein